MKNKSFYNSLRINQRKGRDLQNWQTLDYRACELEDLFEQLNQLGVSIDHVSFLPLADQAENPEELAKELLDDSLTEEIKQRVYLLIFEIWRRLKPEKQSLALLCDELDYRIESYERGQEESSEALQDIIANLAVILDENTDLGEDPVNVFNYVSSECAYDLESFLYRFIEDQIEVRNYSYAEELLEDFSPYISDLLWFNVLRLRLMLIKNDPKVQKFANELVHEILSENDLEISLETLSCLAQGGDRDLFLLLFSHTLSLLKTEEDLQDVLVICKEYSRFLDEESKELMIVHLLDERARIDPMTPLNLSQKDQTALLEIIKE